jgi:hypothetical protein
VRSSVVVQQNTIFDLAAHSIPSAYCTEHRARAYSSNDIRMSKNRQRSKGLLD